MPDSNSMIRLSGVGKDYPLFDNPAQRALEQLGFYSRLPQFMRPQFKLHHALSNVSLDIRRGERVGIVGRNGAGKTTLLKLITGALAPTRGEVQVRGEIHSLLQTGLGFDPEFSGADNIRASLNYNKLSERDLQDSYDDIVDFCELGEHLFQPFRTYSAGMASRLQFATATAIRPDILVIDEVLGAGDSYFLLKSAKRMERLALSGCTLLLVSHATQQILHFCERCLWIEEGQIVMDGPALDVCNAYDVFLERRTLAYKLDLPVSDFDLFAETRSVREGSTEAMTGFDAKGAMISTLADGRNVFRWPANRGVKIRSLSLGNGAEEKETFVPGEPIVITMVLQAEETGDYNCRYLVTFWTPRGIRIGRIENDIDRFSLREGETRTVAFNVSPQPLRRGEYLLSFSVYDVGMERSTRHGADVRYDVLAHALQLSVEDESKDGFLVDQPAIVAASLASEARRREG